MLLIIFIKNLPSELETFVNVSLYADDAKLFKLINNDLDRAALQMALDNLNKWCEKWFLSLNTKKCKLLTVSRKEISEIHTP